MNVDLNPIDGLPDGCVLVNDTILPKSILKVYDEISNWDVTEDDVWISTFPKSGTTWTQEMVWMIMNNLDFEGGKVDIDLRSPYLEYSMYLDTDLIPPTGVPDFVVNSVPFTIQKSKEGKTCIKTHLKWGLLPKAMQSGKKSPKIVYVSRNPKDTCVSYYHHYRIMFGYTRSFETFARSFLKDELMFSPYWDHVLPFWQKRNEPNVLFLRFEDMKKDLPAVIKKVSKFLQKPLTDDQIAVLADHLSFANMKKNPGINHEILVDVCRNYFKHNQEGVFMRSGKVGSYKEAMSDELSKEFDKWTAEHTKGTGLSY